MTGFLVHIWNMDKYTDKKKGFQNVYINSINSSVYHTKTLLADFCHTGQHGTAQTSKQPYIDLICL